MKLTDKKIKLKNKNFSYSIIIILYLTIILTNQINSLKKKESFDFNDYAKNKFSSGSLQSRKYFSNKISSSKSKFKFGVDLQKFNKFYEQQEPQNFLQGKETEENLRNSGTNNSTNSDINFLQKKKGPIRKISDIKDNKFTAISKLINNTFIKPSINVNSFRRDYSNNHIFDYKMLDRELEDLFYLMVFRDQKKLTPLGISQFFRIFMAGYVQCDKDKDNVLNKSEFIACMKADKYLKLITPPVEDLANYKKAAKTPKDFYASLFELLDDRHLEYINFINYAKIRLFLFAWRKCSINSPFIEEKDFECAIDLVSDFKFKSRTEIRQMFFEALYLSNNPSNRNIDFLTFSIIANALRLFSKINIKNDEDITRSEFNMALDVNLLPLRYNQLIIDQFFELMKEHNNINVGIDLQSFIFYDFALQLFSMKKVVRRYFISNKEFPKVFGNPLFPNKTLNEIEMIPQFDITKDSYQMYQYYNMSVIEEEDFFTKNKFFLELENESYLLNKNKNKNNLNSRKNNFHLRKNNLNSRKKQDYFLKDNNIELFNNKFTTGPNQFKNNFKIKVKFNLTNTANKIFKVLDADDDGFINFKEFAIFYQMAYTYSKVDKYSRGKIAAGSLFDLYSTYSDYPAISFTLRDRANRLNNFEANIYFDLLSALALFRIDDLVSYYTRKLDVMTLGEIDLKLLLSKVNMQFLPDSVIKNCMRGFDYNSVPRFDWECTINDGMNMNLNYFETLTNYKRVKENDIKLDMTDFYSVDKNYE